MSNATISSLFNTKHYLVPFLALLLISSCGGSATEDSEAYLSSFIADLWLEGADILKVIWRDCSKKLVDVKDVIDHQEYFPKFVRCMKRKTLRALDRSLSLDVVPIAEGVNLVRFELVESTGDALPVNKSSAWTDKQLDESEWRLLALQRIAKIFRTHVIKFDFDDIQITEKAESRGRRRHHMMTMMMFGIVSIGMVLVPMGFQFLAVLGGKALLLAKMALILASIQGLKKVDNTYEGYHDRGKIASSPLNYGFYHSFPYDHYEKRSIDTWHPRTLTGSTPSSLNVQPQPDIKAFEKFNEVLRDESDEKSNLMKRVSAPTALLPDISKMIKQNSEAKVFPVYPGPSTFTTIDTPPSDLDLARPGQVQADYTLELPYNRFRFQGPTPALPS